MIKTIVLTISSFLLAFLCDCLPRKEQSTENNEVKPSGYCIPKNYEICLEKQNLNPSSFRGQILQNIEANRNKWKDNKEAVNKGMDNIY